MSFKFFECFQGHVFWSFEHFNCHYQIDGMLSSLNPSQNITKTNYKEVNCVEESYMLAIREGLLTSKNPYEIEVYKTLINIYSDLKNQLIPMRLDKDFSVINSNVSNVDSHVLVHPISFCIPEENIQRTLPAKSKSFGRVIPGDYTTYYNLYNESEYFNDLSKSLFAITYKKGGWDCLRHLEILASGSLPLFVGIHKCHHDALSLHPKKLYQQLLNYPGLELKYKRKDRMTLTFETLKFDEININKNFYMVINKALLQYTRNILSTRAVASYVLETMVAARQVDNNTIRNVFYLTHIDNDMNKGDYMTDFLLHGLKAVLGDGNVIDYPRRDGIYKTAKEYNTTDYLIARSKLYGSGFSWGLKIDELHNGLDAYRNADVIKRNLMEHRYDAVILGSGHRDGYASKLHFWDLVCKYYLPSEVGFVFGADYRMNKKILKRYSNCAAHVFSREGYSETA